MIPVPDAELLGRFQTCLRYQQAESWQKPWLNPRRFLRNQLRKRRVFSGAPGTLSTAQTFHLPEFTIVMGETVSQQLVSYGVFEPELTEAFLHLIRPSQIVVDIGMHLGYYATLFAVLVGEHGQVHAFEPTPSTREIAQSNTGRFPQIHVHPWAVWSSVRSITLRDYGPLWMAFNSLGKAKLEPEPEPPREIEVQSITLDQFRRSLDQPVSLVKIDAESAEREILLGGKELLRSDCPLISVEVGDQGGSRESRRLVEDLKAMDYGPWEFQSGRFARHEPQTVYGYDNLIFAPAGLDLSRIC